ncbi:hypothetical protein jhhlp_004629 [Lomentospora prolificans]|uniref:Nnf1-domain-containing protein n=1 Tax=Lomentospora prolificans TaxID=41688 RepID=A0A2N3NC46_9PEZI|nr:hypothetical protein jhhlp_004629 [Lomentospora prolificans]
MSETMSTEPPPTEPQPADAVEDSNHNNNDEARDAPGSPPLPAPHTAVTPGPRAARLQELFATSLTHTLNKISWENLAACYPTIAANSPSLLKGVRQTMVERLETMCKREFERIMDNRAVIPKLNELESLVSEAIRRRESAPAGTEPPTPPHLLPPATVLQAHLSRPLTASQSHLNAKLQNIQAENERLFSEIQAQRAEIANLASALERVCADVDAANGLLREVIDEVAAEAREREVEMAAT